MEAKEFGARLRELRIQAGLTQRKVADRVNIDFSYLSKIENGILPPPSEKVILQLAEALNADKDELITLAGRIPADIAQMLKNRKTLQLLRSDRIQKKVRAPSKESTAMPRLSLPLKNLARVALAIILVVAIGTSLWFASPTKAFEINISPPSPGTLGSTHTFSVQVKIEDNELLPVQSIKLEIYNAADTSKKATLENLPLNDSTEQAHTISEGSASGSALVAADAEDTWGWFHGSPYVYAVWQQQGYSWSLQTYGYGYQTTGAGTTFITYTVKWTSPSGWPAGNYEIKVLITPSAEQATKTLTRTSDAFSLTAVAAAAAPVVVYPEEEAPPPPVGTTDVSDIITEEGVFTESTTAVSDDGWATLTIDEGTTGLTEEGEPLSEISIIWEPEPPAPPEDTNIVGFTYDLEPAGATFDPPITVSFMYREADIPEGVDEEDLVIAFWDEDTGEWVVLEDITVDPVRNTISASVSHFTAFTIIAYIPPVAPPPAPPAPPPAPPVPAPAPPAPPPAPPVPAPAPPAPPPAPPAPPAPPPVPPAPPAPPPTPVWLLVIIGVATAIVVGVVIWWFGFRRTYY